MENILHLFKMYMYIKYMCVHNIKISTDLLETDAAA